MHQPTKWWPCHIIDAVECLKDDKLVTMYQVSLYFWPEESDDDSTIFVMTNELRPLDKVPKEISRTKHLNRALRAAKQD